MEAKDLKTLQLVAIQHELAMVTGLDLNLDRMLSPFMRTCLRRLGLRSIHFYQFPETDSSLEAAPEYGYGDAVRRLSVPSLASGSADAAVLDGLPLDRALEPPTGTHHVHGDRHYLTFPLEGVGFMVLERARRPIDVEVARSLEPIFARLNVSCRACLEHHRILEEIAARKEAEAVIVRQAAYDTLTDLPNRKTLNQRLRQAVAAARRHRHYGAVYFIDVDRFKSVNDSLGHAAGDALLVEIARRLASVAREEDTVARVGGDEFIFVASQLGDTVERATYSARVLAERIVEMAGESVRTQGTSVVPSASVGLTLFPDPNLDTLPLGQYCEDLVRFADTAMYRAKEHSRGGFEFFAPEMQAASNRRLRMETHLRQAVAGSELQLHYQPVVTPLGTILGAEALLRWSSDDMGAVSPADFIPVAEETGLILEIGDWVLGEACRLIAHILEVSRSPSFRSLSVNLSARQIRQPGFVAWVKDAVLRSGIPPRALILELTESAALTDLEDTVRKMSQLTELGVRFALDDFGTGYSSLSYLHRLPVSMLKIDRSFVTGIRERPDHQGIVDATLAMARHLKIACIIEGVESQSDVDYFGGVPVLAMQGYHFSRPLPEAHFLELLASGTIPGSPAAACPASTVRAY
ncbi:MAG: EAL domain-containing protein [Gemmatimonadota bacterium]